MPDERVNPQLGGRKQAKRPRCWLEVQNVAYSSCRRAGSPRSADHFGVAPRWKRIAFLFLLSGVLGCLPARGHTAGLDCPEMGPGTVPNLLSDVQVKLVTSSEQRRCCQRNIRSHQQAADREAQHLVRRADGCPGRGLLSRGREHGESDGLREMASHAAVRYHPATAARSQHDAVGLSHHRQCTASTFRLPRTQKPSGKHRSNPGAIDGGNPLSCGRKVVARGYCKTAPLESQFKIWEIRNVNPNLAFRTGPAVFAKWPERNRVDCQSIAAVESGCWRNVLSGLSARS